MTLEQRIEDLEKKVAALEGQVQEQPTTMDFKITVPCSINAEELKKILSPDRQKRAFDLLKV